MAFVVLRSSLEILRRYGHSLGMYLLISFLYVDTSLV
jgi:hypothetical protein